MASRIPIAITVILVFAVFLFSCSREDERLVRVAKQQLTLGMVEEAARSYRKALAINPRNIQAHLGMAILYYRKGQIRESLESIYRISILGKLNKLRESLLDNFGWMFYISAPSLTFPGKSLSDLVFSPDHRYVAFTIGGKLQVLACGPRLQKVPSQIDPQVRFQFNNVKWIDSRTLLGREGSFVSNNFRWYVLKITDGIIGHPQFLWEAANVKISPNRNFIIGEHVNARLYVPSFYEDSTFLVARLKKEEEVFVKVGSIFKVKGYWISFDWLSNRTLRISYYSSDTNGDGKIDFADKREDLYFDIPLMKKLKDYSNESRPEGEQSPDGKYSLLVRKNRLILRDGQGGEKELGLEGNIWVWSWVSTSQAVISKQIQNGNQLEEKYFLVDTSGGVYPFPQTSLPQECRIGDLKVFSSWVLLSIVKKLSPQEEKRMSNLSFKDRAKMLEEIGFLREIWLVDSEGRRVALITSDSLPFGSGGYPEDFWVLGDRFLLVKQSRITGKLLAKAEIKSVILDMESGRIFVLPFELKAVESNFLFFAKDESGMFVVELREDLSGKRINGWRKFYSTQE